MLADPLKPAFLDVNGAENSGTHDPGQLPVFRFENGPKLKRIKPKRKKPNQVRPNIAEQPLEFRCLDYVDRNSNCLTLKHIKLLLPSDLYPQMFRR
jgi:hypothetical protein